MRSQLWIFAGIGMVSFCPTLCALEPPRVIASEKTISLRWPAQPRVLLQSSTGATEWQDVEGSQGRSFHLQDRTSEQLFFRLVRLREALGPSSPRLKTLTEIATSLAINQIRLAIDPTFEPDGKTLPPHNETIDAARDLTKPFAWASQPGMISVHEPGKLEAIKRYKLYSSSDGILSSEEDPRSDEYWLSAWEEGPDQWVNLNEAYTEAEGRVRFPIIDPRVSAEGFSTSARGPVPAAMPVMWLYRLEDGSLGTVDSQGKWLGQGEATAENPISARIAYWLDDETCKINVNTATEGVFWDFPRADTPRERQYALRQPVRREIQRYPGHPATTCISSVLYPGKAANHPNTEQSLSNENLERIYTLVPRVVHSGSLGGTTTPNEAVTFDADPLFTSISGWEQKAGLITGRWQGLVTTFNPAPETTLHGRPRISIWPVAEDMDSNIKATDYDRGSAELSTLGNETLVFQRRYSTDRDEPIYQVGGGRNRDLFRMLLHQVYQTPPGYRHSLSTKYGARLAEEDYTIDTDFDKDHYQIALMMFQHIRNTNLLDPGVEEPFNRGAGEGFGQVTGASLADRNLQSGDGNAYEWYEPSTEPQAAGRFFTISEVALVAYNTGTAKLNTWREDSLILEATQGVDTNIIYRIIMNDHPRYEAWRGRQYDERDEGKVFHYIEFGLIIELFSPCQGYPRIHPRQSIRLLTRGKGYKGGVSERVGLKANGVPLELWGDSIEALSGTVWGPLSFIQPSLFNPPPKFWRGLGGHGGPRILTRFGTFEINETTIGYRGFPLANGAGPLNGFYCQTAVILREDEDLILTQDEPIQLLISDSATEGKESHIAQVINLRFVEPGRSLRLSRPSLNSSNWQGWTRRNRQAYTAAQLPQLAPEVDRETITSALCSHGDYRHLAAKRQVPSELLRLHPLVGEKQSAHSLRRASSAEGSLKAEPGAQFAPELFGRGMIEGVHYPLEVMPDFTFDPVHRTRFAPLLGNNYRFSIDPSITRDFNTGIAREPDGAYLNQPNEGASVIPQTSLEVPYFELEDVSSFHYEPLQEHQWFPRRMASSPVLMGSIPSAIQANAPWTTLLFRPNMADPNNFPHLGEKGNGMVLDEYRKSWDGLNIPQMASVRDQIGLPPDHLWLDLFWMPTVEPTHVSTPFATQGKVNMNYEMVPYPHIRRATALHAALKSERLLAIPTSAGPTYKTSKDNPDWRHMIDPEETLKQFTETFAQSRVFLTESEICEKFLVPDGVKWDKEAEAVRAFWDQHRLSGDNVLERPYAGLYSRLTTRSNAFRLHLWVQRIDKDLQASPEHYDSIRDRIVEEYRGSARITRVLNHTHPNLPRYASSTNHLPAIEGYYDYLIQDEQPLH